MKMLRRLLKLPLKKEVLVPFHTVKLRSPTVRTSATCRKPMMALCRILLLTSAVASFCAAPNPLRTKRGLLELAGAIQCSTGRSALSYMMYGCYCGLGGQGWPRDKADWCCHKHDCCYGDAESLGCQTKTAQYRWTCEDKKAECDDLKDECEKMLCKCDREAARCLRKAPFRKKYAVWPDFMCGDVHPTCNIY